MQGPLPAGSVLRGTVNQSSSVWSYCRGRLRDRVLPPASNNHHGRLYSVQSLFINIRRMVNAETAHQNLLQPHPHMSQQQKVRRLVLTGAVTAITIAGAWYGAGLKTQQTMKKVALLVIVVSLRLLSAQTQCLFPTVISSFVFANRSILIYRKSNPAAKPRLQK